ncbi:MAG: response regulator [Candidatus Eisenbacteria bacterium]|nr:response regulator [Candidatus Eisenbacteria bacterium]
MSQPGHSDPPVSPVSAAGHAATEPCLPASGSEILPKWQAPDADTQAELPSGARDGSGRASPGPNQFHPAAGTPPAPVNRLRRVASLGDPRHAENFLLRPGADLHSVLWGVMRGSDRTSPAARTESAAPLQAGRSLRVLLAEDNVVNRLVITSMLGASGHACTEVVDGQSAIDALARETFNLVLMDVEMPGIGGFEATRLIREAEAPSGRHVPIVALTAHAMTGDREKCLAAGMDEYLSKPIQRRELLALIDRMFPAADDESAPMAA